MHFRALALAGAKIAQLLGDIAVVLALEVGDLHVPGDAVGPVAGGALGEQLPELRLFQRRAGAAAAIEASARAVKSRNLFTSFPGMAKRSSLRGLLDGVIGLGALMDVIVQRRLLQAFGDPFLAALAAHRAALRGAAENAA